MSTDLYDKLINRFIHNYAYKHSQAIKDYRLKLSNYVLSKQARLFYINMEHSEPSGSVTFIKYKGEFFVVTNEHCVRMEDKNNYKVIVPSKKTDTMEENQSRVINIDYIDSDKENDLAAFLIEKDALIDSRRSFLEVYPTSRSVLLEESEVVFIGVPGERLEYRYNEDYTFLHQVLLNHITYFTVHEKVEDQVHTVKISSENEVFLEEDKSLCMINSFKGMSGSPAFTHSYTNLDIRDLRFLGVSSNGNPSSKKAYVLDVSLIISFLDKIIEMRISQ